MNALSKSTKTYITMVVVMAAVCVSVYVPDLEISQASITGLVVFVFLSAFSEYLSVQLPYVGDITVTYAVDLALLILYGIPATIIVAVLGYLGSRLVQMRKKPIAWPKVIFNLAQFILTITASGITMKFFMNQLPSGQWYMILAIAAGALVYFFVNILLVTLLFAFLQSKSVLSVWALNIRWLIPNFLALGPIGYVLAYVYSDIGFLGLIIFFLPMLLARHSFKLYMDMREMYLRTIQNLASIIDTKDHYTAGHSERVACYVVGICQSMELAEEYIENLKDLALLHDIGKISIPEHILNKPGCLVDEEMLKMKTHPGAGYDVVKKISFLKEKEAIKYHHERWDGKGYPAGLKGEEIPIGARIISVADSFDAMTSDRPYRQGMKKQDALAELARCKGTQFDPIVVEAFIEFISRESESQGARGINQLSFQ